MKMPLSNYIWIFIFIRLYTSLKTAPVIGLAKISRLVIHTDSKIHTNTITHIQRESVKWTFQVKACLLFICMFLTCIPIHVFPPKDQQSHCWQSSYLAFSFPEQRYRLRFVRTDHHPAQHWMSRENQSIKFKMYKRLITQTCRPFSTMAWT